MAYVSTVSVQDLSKRLNRRHTLCCGGGWALGVDSHDLANVEHRVSARDPIPGGVRFRFSILVGDACPRVGIPPHDRRSPFALPDVPAKQLGLSKREPLTGFVVVLKRGEVEYKRIDPPIDVSRYGIVWEFGASGAVPGEHACFEGTDNAVGD